MKQSSLKVFQNKKLKVFSKPFHLEGLTESSLILYLSEVLKINNSSFFVSFKTQEEAYRLYRRAKEFNDLFLFYPENPSVRPVPGFNSEWSFYKKEALIQLSSKNLFCCFGTDESFIEKNIPLGLQKGVQEKRLGVGDNFELYDLIKFLNTNGYSKTDLVYQPGYYASRGDVLDIYPKHFKKPFRLSFDFDTIELISTFDPLSQLTERVMLLFV